MHVCARKLCACLRVTDGEHSNVPDLLRELWRAEDKFIPDRRLVRGNQHAAVSLVHSVSWNRGFVVVCGTLCGRLRAKVRGASRRNFDGVRR